FTTQASLLRRLYGEHATNLVARETGGRLSNWNHLDNSVVVEHPAWVQVTGRDQDIDLWPVALQAPRLDPVDTDTATKLAPVIAQQDGITRLQPQPLRVFKRHQHVISLGAGEGIGGVKHHAIELLPPPGRAQEATLGHQ